MSLRSARRLLLTACSLLGLAIGGLGCLSDDTAVTVPPFDASAIDGSPAFVNDAGDGGGSIVDGGADSTTVDATTAPDASDGGTESGPSQAGLVGGGTVGHSPHYAMTLTSGPATAPVRRSPNYKLVGGLAVTGK